MMTDVTAISAPSVMRESTKMRRGSIAKGRGTRTRK
jgi:hypothetical protein